MALCSMLLPVVPVVYGYVFAVVAVLIVFVPVYPTLTFSFVDVAKPRHL